MPTFESDLAVLGAGAAGMLAALCAAKRGWRVALYDPCFTRPNNLAISGGLFPAAGSLLQAAAGVEDSPRRWLDDLRKFAPDSTNERIATSVAERLPQVVRFLVERCTAPIAFLPDVPAPGHSARRFHSVQPASGHGLHAWLRDAVAREPSLRLVVDHAVSVHRAGDHFLVEAAADCTSARHLLLAGGGFGANPAMIARYIPGMTGALHSGSPTNDGSVLAMAIDWGAAVAGMDGYQGQGHTSPGGRTRLSMALPTLGSVLVDREGRRFVREDIGPSALAAHVLAQPGQVALEIFDRHIEDQMANHSAYREARAAGQVLEADTPAALARAAGIPEAALCATLAEAGRCARGEAQDPLGRTAFARILTPPLRAAWVTGSLAHTQGGVVTDGDGRVVDIAGKCMDRLYAAGGCAAGLSGRGGEGYMPGNGLAQAFGLAYAAVEAMTAT